MPPAIPTTAPKPVNHLLAPRAKGNPVDCVFKDTGYDLLNQGTIAHQLVLVAIGIGAGMVITLLFQYFKNCKGGGGESGAAASAANPNDGGGK